MEPETRCSDKREFAAGGDNDSARGIAIDMNDVP
jgi:hypothetical protein